jgi:glycosyltransferase involved in cell wall biosynthesis
MQSNPELIVVSQNLLGGGSSFHRNMLANRQDNFFDLKCIYLDPLHWNAKRLEDIKLGPNDVIFEFENEAEFDIAKRLSKHISNREGVIVANLPEELISLSFFPKSNKTVYFICHDKGFLYLVKKYDYIIDIFIAHNIEVFDSIRTLLPARLKDIYFIQHGVKIQNNERYLNKSKNLNLVFLARHVKIKGIYDLPLINQGLLNNNISVNWTVLGDGEESERFKNEVSGLSNFYFDVPKTGEDVLMVLKNMDIFILPSSHDGLPVSLLEAMSVGCVPIVYNFSEGIKKVISKDIGFVVDVSDVNGIVEKIATLEKDRELLFELSENCINKVKNDFNIKIQSNKYFNLYKNFRSIKKKRKLTLLEKGKKYERIKLISLSFRLFRFLKKKFN